MAGRLCVLRLTRSVAGAWQYSSPENAVFRLPLKSRSVHHKSGNRVFMLASYNDRVTGLVAAESSGFADLDEKPLSNVSGASYALPSHT